MKYLQLMRPPHWTKNFFVFAALIFGKKLAGSADEVIYSVGSALGAFFCFCLASSAIYVFNDVIDAKADRVHPEKRNRPIAAGKVSVGAGVFFSLVLGIVSVFCSFMLVRQFAYIILCYIIMMVLYSVLFKKMIILDCVIISIGFCLRAVAGAIVVSTFISPWLIICTFALSLFLAFGKRRSEIEQLGDNIEAYRQTLCGYTPELLAHMLNVTSGLAVVCFLLYAMDERTYRLFGTNNLVYTMPMVLYCIFRFSALIQKGKYSGPVSLILHDIPFQISFLLWSVSCVAIVYADKLVNGFGNIWAY
ncbi:MAG: decaprenyl-phosphate phosphoribosyltransferase [Planctomycetes bacterium]|nr:decaprenyl-phosphate phosphoribosyltransferase [Planctomycetota bacterium]